MNLAVKLYSEATEDEKACYEMPPTLPAAWPVIVIELGEETEIPEGFVLMTLEEYTQYRADHMQEYLESQNA